MKVKTVVSGTLLAICGAAGGGAYADETPRLVHRFLEVRISPTGDTVASVEGDAPPSGFYPTVRDLVIRNLRSGVATRVDLRCGRVRECWPGSPAWSPTVKFCRSRCECPADTRAR